MLTTFDKIKEEVPITYSTSLFQHTWKNPKNQSILFYYCSYLDDEITETMNSGLDKRKNINIAQIQ